MKQTECNAKPTCLQANIEPLTDAQQAEIDHLGRLWRATTPKPVKREMLRWGRREETLDRIARETGANRWAKQPQPAQRHGANAGNGEIPPRPHPVRGETLPGALVPLTDSTFLNWVAWKFDLVADKWTKPPYNPRSPRSHARNDDPATWATYKEAKRAAQSGDFREFGGVGLCLLNLPIGAFDIDNCRDPETGAIDRDALALVNEAASYCEITPSGAGLRVIGHIAPDAAPLHRQQMLNRAVKVECYRRCARYITVTGAQLPSTPDAFADIDALQDSLSCRTR